MAKTDSTRIIDEFDAEIAALYSEVWLLELERDARDAPKEGHRHDALDLGIRTLRARALDLDNELNILLNAAWVNRAPH